MYNYLEDEKFYKEKNTEKSKRMGSAIILGRDCQRLTGVGG